MVFITGRSSVTGSPSGSPSAITTSSSVTKSGSDMFSCSQQSIIKAMDRFVKAVNNMDATVLVPSKLRDMELTGGKKTTRVPPPLANTDLYSFYQMLNDVEKELKWGPSTGAVAAATMGGSGNSPSGPSSPSGLISGRCLLGSGRSTPRDSGSGSPSSGSVSSGCYGHRVVVNNNTSCHSTQVNKSVSNSSSGNSSHINSSSEPMSLNSIRSALPSSTSSCSSSSSSSASSSSPSPPASSKADSTDDSASEKSEVDSLMTDRDSVGDEQTFHLASAFRHHLQGLHTILHQLADSADHLSNRYQEEIEDEDNL